VKMVATLFMAPATVAIALAKIAAITMPTAP
jgi:hypothetical protein